MMCMDVLWQGGGYAYVIAIILVTSYQAGSGLGYISACCNFDDKIVFLYERIRECCSFAAKLGCAL